MITSETIQIMVLYLVFQSLHLGKTTPVFILALVLVILASHGQIDK